MNGNASGNGHGGAGDGRMGIRLLIADSDPDHRDLIRNALSTQPGLSVVANAGDGERAARLAAQLQPDVAILEVGLTRTDGSDAAESIAVTSPACQLIIVSPSNDPTMLRRAMLAGAREFLLKPVDGDQLVQAIFRVYDFMSKRQAAVAADDTARPIDRAQSGKVFTVWGPKGGVGRTFLAVNLAVAFATTERRRTLLMDGCLGFCTADVALDIEGKKTIFDLAVDNDADLDPDLIERVVVHHPSGIDVLLAPSVENMLVLPPAQLQRILSIMRRIYECIVVDTRPLLDETTVVFLDLSDVILTICNPEIASLRNLRIFLDAATRLGYSNDKIRLIINRFDMRGAITLAEIEKVCRFRVTYSIPNDHEAVANSINHGKPLVTAQPQRQISKEINRLSSLLIGADNNKTNGDKGPKIAIGRIFGRSDGR